MKAHVFIKDAIDFHQSSLIAARKSVAESDVIFKERVDTWKKSRNPFKFMWKPERSHFDYYWWEVDALRHHEKMLGILFYQQRCGIKFIEYDDSAFWRWAEKNDRPIEAEINATKPGLIT